MFPMEKFMGTIKVVEIELEETHRSIYVVFHKAKAP
jgi:hypothetical protein